MYTKISITGTDKRKCMEWFMTQDRGMSSLGKLSFFMREALSISTKREELTELENHCHGNRAVMRKRG
jgi:hypothetical protein